MSEYLLRSISVVAVYLVLLNPAKANEFTSYSVQQGLNHTHVLSMHQDSQGFLWIGTYGGLHRFDGYNFKLYTVNGPFEKTITNNSVNVIYEDSKGYLWFGTENGLNKYNPKTGNISKYWHIEGELNFSSVKTIYEDTFGNIWIGTYGGGLNKLNIQNNTFEYFNATTLDLPDNGFNKINIIFNKGNNDFWIGTEDGGLYVFNTNTLTITSQYLSLDKSKSIPSIISTIKKTKNNNIWVGTWNDGLFKYNESNSSFEKQKYFKWDTQGSENINVKDIVEDDQGNLWLGHFGNGITKLNTKDNTFQRFTYSKDNPFSINSNMVWNLFIDNTGILWIGTFGGGVNKLKLNQYKIPLIEIPSELSEANANTGVSSIIQDSKGTVWVGTFGSGLYQYNIEKNKFTPINIFKKGTIRAIMSMYEDKNGNIWVGTDLGLHKIDSTRKAHKHYKNNPDNSNSIIDEPIYRIFQDSKQNLWFGTWNGGLQLLPAEEANKKNSDNARFTSYRHNNEDSTSISHDIVYAIMEDMDGQIWVGTSEFLDRLNPESNQFSRVHQTVVSSIHQDEEGTIWVSSLSNGLFALNKHGKVLKHYETLHDANIGAKKNTVVTGMTPLKDNELWLTNNYGLSSFNKATESFSNFSLKNDLFQNALSLNAIIALNNGKIIIGGIDGFNIIDPTKLVYETPLPDVIISDIKVFNQSILQGQTPDSLARIKVPANELETLQLSYKDKMLVIEYAAIEFFAPDQILYAYKLEGFDQDWVNDIHNARYASYSNLKPGAYTFMVKATNSKGHWSNKVKTLSIDIKPPFWDTLWFKLVLIFAVILLVFLIVRIRTRMLYQQKKILQDLVEEQTSEIIQQNQVLAKANKELNTQKEEILEKTEEANMANERKLRFFTSMSHEFRTPLTLILGPLDNLLDKLKKDRESTYNLSVIQKNALRLLRLINDILDLRKFDTNNMKVVCTKRDLVAFVSSIVEAFVPAANKRNIQLNFVCNYKSFTAWFDAGKLEIVFYNLISNALKFSEEKDAIDVSINIDENINIKIKDTGIGIKSEKLPYIFDRFYQAELNDPTDYKGTGIGLSLTKEIIESIQGTISAKSKPNEGTTFLIKLPILLPENTIKNPDIVFNNDASSDDYDFLIKLLKEPNIENTIEPNAELMVSESAETVLLVEDDTDLRAFIKTCLLPDYKIITANNGEEGLVFAKKEQPSLVISDIMMPVMDGIEFCGKLKSDFSTSHIPVILLSAKTSMELQLEGFETGADAFIPKPFNKTYLLTRVKAIIKSRQTLSENFQKQASVEPKDIAVTSVDEQFIQKTKELVEQNMENSEFGVNELVNELAISRTLLHMKLKKLTNCSTSEFIRLMRLKRACQLLDQKKHRVSDICYMVGFNDPHSFSKIFKKHFGVTPTQYADKD